MCLSCQKRGEVGKRKTSTAGAVAGPLWLHFDCMFLIFIDKEWCRNPAELHFHSVTSQPALASVTAVCLILINKPVG